MNEFNETGIEMEMLSGKIVVVVFRNEENGYTVLKAETPDLGFVTVVGCVPFACAGQSFYAEGCWEKNPAHGEQFKAENVQLSQPDNRDDIFAYLTSGAIKGIGPATASLIINSLGDETLKVIAGDPERLAAVKGIGKAKANRICSEYKKQLIIDRLSEYVCVYRLRPYIALRLYACYGIKAVEELEGNPYVIAEPQIGGAFAEADGLALSMGFDDCSDSRIKAAILYELSFNTGNGHCFIPREKLCTATAKLISVDEEDISTGIDALIEEGDIVLEQVAGCNACYLPELYEAESYCADRLFRMASGKYDVNLELDSFIASVEKRERITYTDLQKSIISMAAANRILVITGGPGTGKTTSLNAVLALFKKLKLDVVLTAPTGRAAKRMSEITGCDAYTVHRLLGAKMGEEGERVSFDKNEDNLLVCDAVIMDECSMVDILLFSALLKAISETTRLILVGDADQLPPVGPGNMFSALIRSGVIPTVSLNEIFRQNSGSSIIKNAHLINSGSHPNFGDNSGDFFRLKRIDAMSTVETVTELFSKRLPSRMGFELSDIQVLSPSRKGELGTVNLNKNLQKALNPASPAKKEKLFGEKVFREGDKVMQIKNNYDMVWRSKDGNGSGIYNGDMGTVLKVDNDNACLNIDFDGKSVLYSYDFLSELEHAWAVTVHKSQGSEYKAVILVLSDHSSLLLTRGVLYTAVSRARNLLVMVGDDNVAHRMIDNYRQNKRYCALRFRLAEKAGKTK